MVRRSSLHRERLLAEFGLNLRRWRKANGMSATELADRASISRNTLNNLESGSGSTRTDTLFAVLIALGIADTVVKAADPYNSDSARARIDAILRAGGRL